MNDILLVDKPAGWTSFDVVAKIRGKIRAGYIEKGVKPTKRQLKVGHAGTLDPFATGLLIVLLGDATKEAEKFLKLDKVYEATVQLGATSTTGDPEGVIEETERPKDRETGKGIVPNEKSILEALETFQGQIEQIPPAYSAIKVDGERAYKLARKGQTVDIPPRQVTIYSLELVDYTYPELKIRAHVSSGTYIRTLAEDIGKQLGTGAYCKELRRTRIGKHLLSGAVSVETAGDSCITEASMLE
ncbi:MAG TPA: tRNA pseudouridine(55) synthase TruB [Candidatus Saccharibacteria bacterium]|nr:tRNA pseudouridine(55) synthase TruB [Candidatus Saccharibacteria bacterium]